jgi:hypothetical protein
MHGNMPEMIPVNRIRRIRRGTSRSRHRGIWFLAGLATAGIHAATPATTTAPGMPAALPPPPAAPSSCLPTGDGYLRARVAGAIDARIDWPNAGTRCQGETKLEPPGIRLSFQRAKGGKPNLLFVFGLTGIREGAAAHDSGVNLTVILQGTPRIYGTLGDTRCTIDSLTQKPLTGPHTYRVEARGFCTQPAHAVRGNGDVLVSTFEFAGPVNYGDGA